MKSPLLITLEITATLCDSSLTAAELQEKFGGIGIATLKRYIADARHLGAQIESIKSGKSWSYQVLNPGQIRTRLAQWIELEQKRDLTS